MDIQNKINVPMTQGEYLEYLHLKDKRKKKDEGAVAIRRYYENYSEMEYRIYSESETVSLLVTHLAKEEERLTHVWNSHKEYQDRCFKQILEIGELKKKLSKKPFWK